MPRERGRPGCVAGVALAVVLAVLLAACDGRRHPPAPREDAAAEATAQAIGCDLGDEAAPRGRSRHHIAFGDGDGDGDGGGERAYDLYVPEAGAGRNAELPLVLTLHGYGSNGAQQLAYTGVEQVAEEEGFVVAAPTAGGDPPRFELFGTEDVEYVLTVIRDVRNKVCVDADRVYSMGMSNGAAMSAVLACRAGRRFAAIALVAAVVYSDEVCAEGGPIAVVAFMGTDDRIVPFEGGVVACCGNPTVAPAPEAMAGWARHNGCAAGPLSTPVAADVELRRWERCTPGADTLFYVIHGGGHTWPGGVPVDRLGTTTTGISATRTIWDFFAAHVR